MRKGAGIIGGLFTGVAAAALLFAIAPGWAGTPLAGLPSAQTPIPTPSQNPPATPVTPAAAAADDYPEVIKPFVTTYCYKCHNATKKQGGLNLESYGDSKAVIRGRKEWLKIYNMLMTREMPPEDTKKQPTEAERTKAAAWIEATLAKLDCSGSEKYPGRVTIRRLNRTEYNNTIRDLMGVDFQPAKDFPADDVGYGFDNIGDVLSVPPLLLEKYLAAAEQIVGKAIMADVDASPPVAEFKANQFTGGTRERGAVALLTNGEATVEHRFPFDGQYFLSIRAGGDLAGPDFPKMEVKLDGKSVKVVDVDVDRRNAKVFQVEVNTKAGSRKISLGFTNNYKDLESNDPKLRGDRNLYVMRMEVRGPKDYKPVMPEPHRRLFVVDHTKMEEMEAAKVILSNFLRRAWRRPVSAAEVDRVLKFVKLARSKGDSFESSIGLAVQASLVSPHFLFRMEKDPDTSDGIRALSDFEIAGRLSYFLWSSMPDEELFLLAKEGKLKNPAVLAAQVKRMLKDGKSRALVDNFAGQWLQLRTLDTLSPDPKLFPAYAKLKNAIRAETEMFFEEVVREDRSVLDFLSGRYTYLNADLAAHYGYKDLKLGDEMKRVTISGDIRSGVVTHASILTITSNPDRTSPVKRGKWILENILGTPPPPAPAAVPELETDSKAELKGTLRQRMEQHRADPTCASCHRRMDPLGFSLENFNAVGAWRTADGKHPIDATGELPTGEKFEGPSGLKKVLAGKKDDFVRCLTEKMLTYSLGRGLEYYDACAVDQIMKAMKRDDYRFSTLVTEIALSYPFQYRGGRKE